MRVGRGIGQARDTARGGKAVAEAVGGGPDPVRADPDQIGGAGSVDIGQPQAARIKAVAGTKARRIGHGHPPPKAAMAEIGPIADLGMAQAHDIAEPVAGHVGQQDCLALGGGRKQKARPGAVIGRERQAPDRVKARPPARRVDEQPRIRGDQKIGAPVPGQIDETQVGIVEIDARQGLEGDKGRPAPLGVAFK